MPERYPSGSPLGGARGYFARMRFLTAFCLCTGILWAVAAVSYCCIAYKYPSCSEWGFFSLNPSRLFWSCPGIAPFENAKDAMYCLQLWRLTTPIFFPITPWQALLSPLLLGTFLYDLERIVGTRRLISLLGGLIVFTACVVLSFSALFRFCPGLRDIPYLYALWESKSNGGCGPLALFSVVARDRSVSTRFYGILCAKLPSWVFWLLLFGAWQLLGPDPLSGWLYNISGLLYGLILPSRILWPSKEYLEVHDLAVALTADQIMYSRGARTLLFVYERYYDDALLGQKQLAQSFAPTASGHRRTLPRTPEFRGRKGRHSVSLEGEQSVPLLRESGQSSPRSSDDHSAGNEPGVPGMWPGRGFDASLVSDASTQYLSVPETPQDQNALRLSDLEESLHLETNESGVVVHSQLTLSETRDVLAVSSGISGRSGMSGISGRLEHPWTPSTPIESTFSTHGALTRSSVREPGWKEVDLSMSGSVARCGPVIEADAEDALPAPGSEGNVD